MESVFEREFRVFVEAALADVVRKEVHAEIERLREPWVSVKRAAELLSCSVRSVHRAIAAGQLNVSDPLGKRLIERASIEKLIEVARMPSREWRHPWLQQPRIGRRVNPGDHEKVRQGKLGYQRAALRKQGLSEEEAEKVLRAQGLVP